MVDDMVVNNVRSPVGRSAAGDREAADDTAALCALRGYVIFKADFNWRYCLLLWTLFEGWTYLNADPS